MTDCKRCLSLTGGSGQSLSCHAFCPKKFDWKYNQRLVKKYRERYFFEGSLSHMAAFACYTEEKDNKKEDVL